MMSVKAQPSSSSQLVPPEGRHRLTPSRVRSSSVSSEASSHLSSHTPSSNANRTAPVQVHRVKANMPKFMRQGSIAGRHRGHQSAILGAVEIHERALLCFWPDHPIRRFCIELANTPAYTNFNLALILINCCTLMVESGRTLGNSYNFTDLNSTLNCIDAAFAAAFSLEMMVKVVAGGLLFAGPSSYLRSSWNCLDALVVLFALLNFIPSMSNFTYIRALRLIRPLKAASNIPGLRVMMNAMLAATLTLGNVFLFVFLLLFTFAVFGLQIYRNTFWYRCIPLNTGYLSWELLYGFAGCSPTGFPFSFIGPTLCDTSQQFCANSGVNPYADTMGYDNILKSWVMSLIVMSGEGWSDIMYMAEDAVSSLSLWYFILLTCLSNYLGGELVVAVMSVKFEDAKAAEQELMREEEEQKVAVRAAQKKIREFKRNQKRIANAKKKKKNSKAEGGDKSSAQGGGDGGKMAENEAMSAMPETVSYAMMGDLETAQVLQLAAVIKSQNRQKAFERNQISQQKDSGGSAQTSRPHHPFAVDKSNLSVPRGPTFFSSSASAAGTPTTEANLKGTATGGAGGGGGLNHSRKGSTQTGLTMAANDSKNGTMSRGSGPAGISADGTRRGSRLTKTGSVTHSHVTSGTTSSAATSSTDSALSRLNTTFNTAASKWSMHSDQFVPMPAAPVTAGRVSSCWYQVRLVCHRVIFSPASFWIFSFFTVLNCTVLGVDHWGETQETANLLNTFNLIFFVLFLVELVLRLVAIQLQYFQYGYFLLDLIIVVIAGIDTGFAGTVPAVSALRAFRVFRMFTVFRHWAAMQRIMHQAHSSLEDLFYFSLVLFLFVFIFAQMGVQIAKDREDFPQPEGPARDNWDSIGWAMIVVFQVSTPENWNQVLYDIVQGVGWGGGVFVIINLLIGHYIIESLFVVVMFSHFGTDDQEDRTAQAGAQAGGMLEGRSAAVVPIDHVQQMLNRAGVGSSGPTTSDDSTSHAFTQNANDLNRVLSFDSPFLSRPATFASRPTTARTPKRTLQVGGETEEGTRVTGWMDEDGRWPAAHDTAGMRAHTQLTFRAPSSQPEGDGQTQERDGDKGIGCVVTLPESGPNDRPRASNHSSPSPPSSWSRQFIILSEPTGFLSGQPAVSISTKGFLGRLARNIEKSKRMKAEQDRKKEVEKIKARSRSATASRRGSRKDAGDGGLTAAAGRGGGSFIQSRSGDGALSKRGSLSRGAGSGGSTERATAEQIATERDQLETSEETKDRAEADYGNDSDRAKVKVKFELKDEPAEGKEEPAKGSPLKRGEDGAVAEERKDETVGPSSPQSSDLLRPFNFLMGTTNTVRLPAQPSSVVLPPLPIVPALPPPLSPSPAVAAEPSSSSVSIAEPRSAPALPESVVTRSAPAPVPDTAVEPPTPVLLTPPTPLLTASGSCLSVIPAVPTSLPSLPPAYDVHVLKPRRRFVIPHHFPPGQPWYRQDKPEPFTNNSLFLFPPDSRFRALLSRAVHSDAWSIGVLLLIFVSCSLLALDYPALDPNSTEGLTLYWMDLVTTVLYCLEMLCRFVVFGVVLDDGACLRNGWNVMEFVIVLVSIASTVIPSVKELKALRALRPLRILSRLPQAKLVVSSLGKSMLNIANVLVVAFLLLFCLAIVAIALFKGRLQQCLLPPDGTPVPVNEDQCGANGGVWVNPLWIGNYDDLGAALLVMFEICTEENWPTTMTTAVDATEPGLAPDINHNQWVGIYFVVAIVIGSLFIKTLFTATILDGYSLNYAEITGAGGGTSPLQRKWIDFYKLCVDIPPPLSKPRPATKWFSSFDLRLRRFFFDTAKSRSFEWFFLAVISLNVVALCLPYSYESLWYSNVLTVINGICTWLFVAEIIMLWLGGGVRDYFRSRFNQFDFVIVILTVYEFFYDQNLTSIHLGFNPSIFRVIRLIRIRKVFQQFPRLVQLGKTVWFSLPALYNVTLLMVLEYFIFSVLAMAWFGKVKHGFYMTNHGNYETFTSAMVTLFREMTGENWNGIMRDCMVQPPFCSEELGNCGSPILSPLFHVFFQIMSAMLVMDLIVAIILNQFENQLEKEKRMDSAIMSERDMKIFGEHWAHFSCGSYTMPVSKLPAFLRYLPPPLGLTRGSRPLYGVEMAHYLDQLRIPTDRQNVHYLDVIHQLGYRCFSMKHPDALQMEDDEEKSLAQLLSDEDEDEDEEDGGHTLTSSSSLCLSYTTAGIRLANEDMSLIRRQAQRQFPSLVSQGRWATLAGQVHRVVICQKMLRGVFDRKRLRAALVNPLLREMEKEREHEQGEARVEDGQQIGEDSAGEKKAEGERDIGRTAREEAAGATKGGGEREGNRHSSISTVSSPSFRRPPSVASVSSLSPGSSRSGGSRKNSVVAEVMAVRALRSQQAGVGQNRSLSNLSVDTPANRAGAGGGAGMWMNQWPSGSAQPSLSPSHSPTLPPLLTKAVSLPLASTTEEPHEELLSEDEEDGDGKRVRDSEASQGQMPPLAEGKAEEPEEEKGKENKDDDVQEMKGADASGDKE